MSNSFGCLILIKMHVYVKTNSLISFQASLKEIKWKVFESSNISISIEPSHPVITTCSRLFHANRLVTWHLGRNGLQLWIFYWPTDDLDANTTSLLKGNLLIIISNYHKINFCFCCCIIHGGFVFSSKISLCIWTCFFSHGKNLILQNLQKSLFVRKNLILS